MHCVPAVWLRWTARLGFRLNSFKSYSCNVLLALYVAAAARSGLHPRLCRGSSWEGRGATNESTNHTLLALRQQVHPRILPKTLKIHDRVAGPPSIQQRGMTDHLRHKARPVWTIQRGSYLVLRQGPR